MSVAPSSNTTLQRCQLEVAYPVAHRTDLQLITEEYCVKLHVLVHMHLADSTAAQLRLIRTLTLRSLCYSSVRFQGNVALRQINGTAS